MKHIVAYAAAKQALEVAMAAAAQEDAVYVVFDGELDD